MEMLSVKKGRRMKRAKPPRQLPEHAYVILGCVELYRDGVHGYRLGQLLLRSAAGLSLLGLGQLYRALHLLERAGLVKGEIEVRGPARARYRFTMTSAGRTAFRQWLTGEPHGSAPIRDQLLNRLRFADQLPGAVLQRFLHAAIRECEAELEDVRCERQQTHVGDVAPEPLLIRALHARLVAHQRWLDDVRQLVETADRQSA
jgi:DNA-binding PadR family transcriptional regulator